MPIEFACESCARGLRVPDGTSGRRLQCPACGQAQEIPFLIDSGVHAPLDAGSGTDSTGPERSSPERSSPERSSPESGNTGSGSTGKGVAVESESASKLSIPCPKCHHHLICDVELLGTRGQCRKCAHIFTITTEPELSQDSASTGLIFRCPDCQQLFEGREDMRGRKGKCYVCKAVFEIKLEPAPAPQIEVVDRPAQPAVKQPVKQPVKEPVKKPVTRTPAPRLQAAVASGPVRFECVQCQGVMEVPGSAVGLDTACPYCHTVQAIPAPQPQRQPKPISRPRQASQPGVTSGGSYTASGSYQSLAAQYDPLATLDLTPHSNPYAVSTTQWSAPAVTRSAARGALTIGNALQLGFESLFPACLVFFLYVAAMIAFIAIGAAFLAALLGILVAMRLPREAIMGIYFTGVGLFTIASVMAGAWMTACMHHTALRAVRKNGFDLGESLSPGGGYGVALLIGGINMLFSLLANGPSFLNMAYPGTLQSMGVWVLLWLGLIMLLMALAMTATSFGCFAAIDGDGSGEALGTSGSLIFANFPVVIVVKFLAWVLTVILIIPTLGLATMIPFFMNAALYHLARRSR